MTKRQRAHHYNQIVGMIKKSVRVMKLNDSKDFDVEETFYANDYDLPQWAKEAFEEDGMNMLSISKDGVVRVGYKLTLAKWQKTPAWGKGKNEFAGSVRYVQADGSPLKPGQEYDQVIGMYEETLIPMKNGGWVIWNGELGSYLNKKGGVSKGTRYYGPNFIC